MEVRCASKPSPRVRGERNGNDNLQGQDGDCILYGQARNDRLDGVMAGFWVRYPTFEASHARRAHLPPFICYPPAGARSRYPHDSGITRAQRYKNYNDLHSCAQPRPAGRLQPCRSFVTWRTLIGGPAYQTRNGSDLSELLVIASDLTGAFRLPPAFRRPKLWRRGYYAGPPKTCYPYER
jgi:hypothetical protein